MLKGGNICPNLSAAFDDDDDDDEAIMVLSLSPSLQRIIAGPPPLSQSGKSTSNTHHLFHYCAFWCRPSMS
jgi:hypothetical protein